MNIVYHENTGMNVKEVECYILKIRHQTAVYQFHIEILSLCAQF